jgi:hypothetical protein
MIFKPTEMVRNVHSTADPESGLPFTGSVPPFSGVTPAVYAGVFLALHTN